MPDTEMDATYFKTLIKDFCENANSCGFEAFIVKKDSPKLKQITFDEKKDENGTTFKKKIKNMFIEIIVENYLADDIEYEEGYKIANNQHRNYYFKQSSQFNPFGFLNDNEEITGFNESDLSGATGLAFKLRKGNKEIWIYQHLWAIMVPNKKKNNPMVRLLHFDDSVVFSEQKESILTIDRKIDIIVLEGYIITDNVSLLQKHFGFHEYIFQLAKTTIESIATKGILKDTQKLDDYLNRGVTKYAKKLMRINSSKVFNMTKAQIIGKIKLVPRWQNVFEIDEEHDEIALKTYKDVENLIDLFDERFTRSEVTDTEYDTDVKAVANPIN